MDSTKIIGKNWNLLRAAEQKWTLFRLEVLINGVRVKIQWFWPKLLTIHSTLLSTPCFRPFNSLIQLRNPSALLLKILVSVVRFRPWAPSYQALTKYLNVNSLSCSHYVAI